MRKTLGAATFFSFVLVFSAPLGAAPMPWEPTFRWVSNGIDIGRVRAARTIRESVAILVAENCVATTSATSLRWNGSCEFLQATYVATLRSPNSDETIRVAFPFAAHARPGARTLLLDAVEVLD